MHSKSALRGFWVKSKAPAVTRASKVFLLILRVSMRAQKSKTPAKGVLRAERMASMAFSPTPLMAPSPKRMRCFPGFFGSAHPEGQVRLVDVGLQHGDAVAARLGDVRHDLVGVVLLG